MRLILLTKKAPYAVAVLILGGRIPLVAPPTSADHSCATLYREGFLLHLYLEDGIVGLGEVSFNQCIQFHSSP